MPAPTAPVPDREAVRVLAVAVGQREAARRLGLKENTVKSICYRAGDSAAIAATTDTRTPAMHPNAPSPSEAMKSELDGHRDSGTLALARSAARNAQRAESADLLIETPGDLLALAKAHAVIHRLDQQAGGTVVNVAILTG